MKNLLKSLVFVGSLLVATASWALPITTGLFLGSPTAGQQDTLCAAGCWGSVDIDPDTLGTVGNNVNQVSVTGIDIEIDTGGATPATLSFGNIVPGGLATFVGGVVTLVNISISADLASGTHWLVITGNDWGVGGPQITGGGSHVRVPEPSVIALLGIGLIAFGLTRLLRRKNSLSVAASRCFA